MGSLTRLPIHSTYACTTGGSSRRQPLRQCRSLCLLDADCSCPVERSAILLLFKIFCSPALSTWEWYNHSSLAVWRLSILPSTSLPSLSARRLRTSVGSAPRALQLRSDQRLNGTSHTRHSDEPDQAVHLLRRARPAPRSSAPGPPE